MALAQCMHFDASTAFDWRQKGHVLLGAGGAGASSRITILETHQTTSAMTMNAMIELMNAP